MDAEISKEIRAWAYARGIIQGSTPLHQIAKIGEEFGELCNGVLHDNPNDYIDAIGDMVIALTVLGAILDKPIEECLRIAWEEVKTREGSIIKGAFIKEARDAESE